MSGPARLALVAGLLTACSAPAPPTASAEVTCVAQSDARRQLCTVTLMDRNTGRALEGVTVTLSADMPSMPLAHSVRPVTARPAPGGRYAGLLELEMTGRWVIAVRLSGPVNDQLTHTLDVD